MYKARHAKAHKRRVTLPMLVLIAALCVAILVFPTTASGADTTPDAISGSRSAMAQVSSGDAYSVVPSAQHGGSVTPSSSDAVAGKTVTFTVEVTRVRDEVYRFVMPAQSVVIDVAFQYARM